MKTAEGHVSNRIFEGMVDFALKFIADNAHPIRVNGRKCFD